MCVSIAGNSNSRHALQWESYKKSKHTFLRPPCLICSTVSAREISNDFERPFISTYSIHKFKSFNSLVITQEAYAYIVDTPDVNRNLANLWTLLFHLYGAKVSHISVLKFPLSRSPLASDNCQPGSARKHCAYWKLYVSLSRSGVIGFISYIACHLLFRSCVRQLLRGHPHYMLD